MLQYATKLLHNDTIWNNTCTILQEWRKRLDTTQHLRSQRQAKPTPLSLVSEVAWHGHDFAVKTFTQSIYSAFTQAMILSVELFPFPDEPTRKAQLSNCESAECSIQSSLTFHLLPDHNSPTFLTRATMAKATSSLTAKHQKVFEPQDIIT